MKKTLQECKEIVAEQAGCQDWSTVKELEMGVEELTDLANKMFYEQSEWIRVETELPKKTHYFFSDWVLASDKNGNIKIEKYDYEYSRFTEKRYDIREIGDSQVTHWMPLPALPPKQ